jgi:hypothetical protein
MIIAFGWGHGAADAEEASAISGEEEEHDIGEDEERLLGRDKATQRRQDLPSSR